MSEQFQNPIKKIIKSGTIDTPDTQIYDLSLFCLGRDISLKIGECKLDLWA